MRGREVLSLERAAALAGVEPRVLRRAAERGELAWVRLPMGRMGFERRDLEAWAERQRPCGSGPTG